MGLGFGWVVAFVLVDLSHWTTISDLSVNIRWYLELHVYVSVSHILLYLQTVFVCKHKLDRYGNESGIYEPQTHLL